MIPLALKSRQCLIDDIKCLETKLSHLQGRFDLIVNWIRSQYFELSGVPDYVKIAVSEEKIELGRTPLVKVEYDNLDDSSNPISNDDIDTDNQCKNIKVKVDDDILKDIETGPVSRLRIQLEKRKLACREISQDEKGNRNASYSNAPTTTVNEDSPSFPLLIEGDVNLKWENDQLVGDNSADCSGTGGNIYTAYGDSNGNQLEQKEPVKGKRIIKTAKHVQANKAKGLILDAVQYKEMIASLPRDRLTCIVCKKNFATSIQRRRHEIQVHLTKEEQNKFRNRFGNNSDALTTSYTNVDTICNINDEESKNVESTMCDICNYPFKNIESHKLNHLPSELITSVEGKRRPHYRCLKCDTLFSVKAKYLIHITRECKVEEILENSNYAQHTQKLRTEKNFLCNQCGQAFNRKHTLKIHIKAVHAKQRDFKCQFCEKSFAIEFVKNNHEKKHLGTSSVTCELCGFAFTCKQILRNHIRGVHENHRPFECQLCDKRFKTSNARNYHVNTHGNPSGRKRGLNREIDPIQAAAKRRNCTTWINNRIQKVENLADADKGNASSAAAVAKELDESQ